MKKLHLHVFLLLHLINQSYHEVQANLSVTSLPDLLFSGSNPTRSIVEGSVIWLYCEVNLNSSTLSATWNKNGQELVQDVPHIIVRISTFSSFTTILLVLDNVVSSDAGLYQCTAQDGVITASGTALTITVQSNMTGVLRIVSGTTFFANRTAQINGDNVRLTYTAGHIGDDTNTYSIPSVVWLKNGVPASTTPSNMAVGSDGQLSSTVSFTFQESDAGVYHCIFTSTSSQIYGTTPLRLDTGSFTVPERISPYVIFLLPPEKLVLEVRTSGGYSNIFWNRDSNPLGTSAAPALLSEFTHFFEIFVREPTTTSDYGTYDVFYSGAGGLGTIILVVPPALPNTSIYHDQPEYVTVHEGDSITISCTSTGGPVPAITWTLNNQPTSFSQTDIITQPSTSAIRQQDGTFTTIITPGNVISALHIVNPQYPAHDGEYICTGRISVGDTATTNSVNITVQVQVAAEVLVTANHTRVAIGDSLTLTCTVLRGNPMIYTFNWLHEGSLISNTTSSESSSTLHILVEQAQDSGVYVCAVNNSGGLGMANITILSKVPAPIDVVVLSTTSTTITLTWRDPHNFTISHYQVALEHLSNTGSSLIEVIFDSNNAEQFSNGTWRGMVTDLTPGTTYNIIIRSSNGILGQEIGVPSEPVHVVTSSSAHFQLRFQISISCSSWINDSLTEKSMQVADGILSEVRLCCQCSLRSNKVIANGRFLCFIDTPQFVTYRAEIHGTMEVSALDLISCIEKWLASGAVLSVRGQLLYPQAFCPVLIISANEVECTSTMLITSSGPMTSTEVPSESATLIVAIIAIVLVVAGLLSTTFLIIFIFILKRKRRLTKKKDTAIVKFHSSDSSSKKVADQLETSKESHEYENVAVATGQVDTAVMRFEAHEEEFSFSSCEAYAIHKAGGIAEKEKIS